MVRADEFGEGAFVSLGTAIKLVNQGFKSMGVCQWSRRKRQDACGTPYAKKFRSLCVCAFNAEYDLTD